MSDSSLAYNKKQGPVPLQNTHFHVFKKLQKGKIFFPSLQAGTEDRSAVSHRPVDLQ